MIWAHGSVMEPTVHGCQLTSMEVTALGKDILNALSSTHRNKSFCEDGGVSWRWGPLSVDLICLVSWTIFDPPK